MEHSLQITDCQGCGSNNLAHYVDLKDYFLTGESFSILECKNCGLLITNPQPLPQNLARYYQSNDYISHSNKRSDLISRIYQLVRTYTLGKKVNIIKRFTNGKEVLDIGCATGEFLDRCKNSGYNVTGIEPDEGARTFAQKTYGLKVLTLDEVEQVSSGSFDVITQWHVLEHVSALNERFELMHKLLKKDGICILALPNPASADAAYYKKFWAAWDVPRHLFHFRRQSLKALAQKHHFEVINILPMKFDSYYVSILSEKHMTGSSNYVRAFFQGMRSNLKAETGNKEYSSLIYILKKQNEA